MTYRQPAPAEPVPPPLRFYRVAAAPRIVVLALCVLLAGFFCAMIPLAAVRSSLLCSRGDDARVLCQVEARYPLGIATHRSLASMRQAEVQMRASSGRSGRSSLVLVLATDQGDEEFPGVGTRGERAPGVASGVNSWLNSASRAPQRWPLREGMPAVVVLMLALSLGALLMGSIGFWSTRVTFDPREPRVAVARLRWPARARTEWVPLEHLARARVTPVSGRNGLRYTVTLGGEPPDTPVCDLELRLDDESAANAVVRALAAAAKRRR